MAEELSLDRDDLRQQMAAWCGRIGAQQVRGLLDDAEALAKGAYSVDLTPQLPVIDLAALDGEPPARESLWGSWLPIRQTSLLTGRGGIGKSLFAQNLLASVALGLPFLGMETVRSRCLYVTCEDDRDELWRRIDAFCRSRGRSIGELQDWLHLVSLSGETDTALAVFAGRDGGLETGPRWGQLQGTVARHGVRLVVFDNATDAMAGDHNDLHQVAAFVNLLTGLAQRIDGSFLLLHHPNKVGADWLGSVAWHNKVRSRLIIEDAGEAGDPDARAVRNPKANYGPQGGRIDFRWHEGAFVCDAELPGDFRARLAESAVAGRENVIFLDCLAAATKREQAVSASRSPTFAPSIFAEMPESKGIGRAKLVGAMNRLLTLGQIETGELPWKARDRHQAKGLRVTAANGAANGAANTGAQRGAQVLQGAENRAANAAERNPPPKGGEGAAPTGAAAPSSEDWPEWPGEGFGEDEVAPYDG